MRMSAIFAQAPIALCTNAMLRRMRCVGLALCVGILTTALTSSASAESFSVPITGKITSVIDGDTIVFEPDNPTGLDDLSYHIRIADIDCPEIDQVYGREAKAAAGSILLQQEVVILGKKHDRYSRLIADVVLNDGRIAGEELVRTGACWAYPYQKNKNIEDLQAMAAKDRRGLWADSDIESPWAFRERQGLAKIDKVITGEVWRKLSKRDKFLYIQGFLDGISADDSRERGVRLAHYSAIADQIISHASGHGREHSIADIFRLRLKLETALDTAQTDTSQETAESSTPSTETQSPVELRGIGRQPKFSTEIFNGPMR